VKFDYELVRGLLGIGSAGHDPKPSRPGKRSRARAGGGRTNMRVAKFLSNPIPPPAREYVGKRRNLSARKKRRLRYLASIQEAPQ
jgi:hypothetical protein